MRYWTIIIVVMIGLSSVLVMSSCSLSSKVMNASTYDSIAIGASIEAVEEQAGPPYSVKEERDGTEVYRYIERIQTSPAASSQNTYLLTVINGVVVHKKRIED